MNDLEKQFMRVDIAGENLEKCRFDKTKKFVKILGDETKRLFRAVLDVIKKQQSDIERLDKKVNEHQETILELNEGLSALALRIIELEKAA